MDLQLQDLADKAVRYSSDLGVQYCDARAEKHIKKTVLIENREIEYIKEKNEVGIGIRLLKNNIWFFCSVTNPNTFKEISDKVERILKNSRIQENKDKLVEIYPISANKAKRDFPVFREPTIEELIKIGLEYEKNISDKPRIIKSVVNPWFCESSKYFVSSNGSEILQNYTDVVIDMIATAHESGVTQSINTTEGGRGGLEMIENYKVQNSANEISNKASKLIYAKSIKEEESKIVMNPDFVSLLTHEILGHPSEADRVMGNEMAWAGGAWWKGKIGEKIGSDKLSLFDDPTINHSLGWYYFDDEGVKAQRTPLIKNGVLVNHLQSRETAHVFDTNPTGNMRATSYMFMPLIRMACTCIEKGDWKQEEMIKETKKGYLVSNMKIPSIDMKRHNWSISCQYAQKIENGELTDMLRDVIVIGTAQNFFNSIDACGNDFSIRPITNCGKGDPMQSMMMGNGGPSIRGIATLKSTQVKA